MPRLDRLCLIAIVFMAVALRAGMTAWRSDELTQDRDAYLGIAAGVAAGRGYSSPGSTEPTAYRPPLYPLLLAAGPQSQLAAWVGFLNVLSGTGTVVLALALARRLGLGRWPGLAAASLVAIEPLLVRYASQPMTESVCAFLVTAWLWQFVRWLQCPTRGLAFVTGVLWGLTALCRPTLWAAGGLVAAWWLWRTWAGRKSLPRSHTPAGETAPLPGSSAGAQEIMHAGTHLRDPDGCAPSGRMSLGVAAIAGGLLVVLPWGIRNQVQLGHPILTTTHGGYTLLLGNNEVFYRDVVRQPWGTEWDGSRGPSQSKWIEGEMRALEADGVHGEPAADQWMRQRAMKHMQRDPTGFLAACGLRELWFWSPVPLGDARRGWANAIVWGVGAFYTVQWIGCLAGLIDVWVRRATLWTPGVLLVLSFAGVHLIYWSNARMRAPVAAVLSLLAVRGWLAIWHWQRRVSAGWPGEGHANLPTRPSQSLPSD